MKPKITLYNFKVSTHILTKILNIRKECSVYQVRCNAVMLLRDEFEGTHVPWAMWDNCAMFADMFFRYIWPNNHIQLQKGRGIYTYML